MKIHANARTRPNSRRLLVKRIEEENWSLIPAAEAAGISERSARKWLGRWRAEGEAGLLDRNSAPKRVPSRLSTDRLEAIEALRRLRMTAAEIAEILEMALSTVSRWLAKIGLGKRSRLQPPEPPNRYERKRPGELIHVDIKKLGRISQPGHRALGRGPGRHKGKGKHGWEFVHVCVDDATTAPVIAPPCTPRHAQSSVCAISSPGPIGLAPTARRRDSSKRSRTAGPTEPSMAPRPSEPRRWVAGSITTTSGDDTAPSATGRLRLGPPSWNNVLSNYS